MTPASLLLPLVLAAPLVQDPATAPSGEGGPVQEGPEVFRPLDVFELEWASDPQISPNGEVVVYVRNSMDIMTDRRTARLWILDSHGNDHRPLTDGGRERSPRWSPDGARLIYVADDPDDSGGAQIFCRWMDTGQTAKLTHVTQTPGAMEFSPDGSQIALAMFVPEAPEPLASMPKAPEGAKWADPPKVIESFHYRYDGAGYLEDGSTHLFVLPAEGGTPRQLTTGSYDHGSRPSWTPDGTKLIFSANRRDDADHHPLDSEVWEVDVETGELRQLTDRRGPDHLPSVSPDGTRIVYVGFDDRVQGHQTSRLWLQDLASGEIVPLTAGLDRNVENPRWLGDASGILFQYDDHGDGKIAYVVHGLEPQLLTERVGGLSLGRPYGGGSFSAATTGAFAFTLSGPDHPADVALMHQTGEVRRLTRLNDDLLGHRDLGTVEEINLESSLDGRDVQAWIVKPPGFDPAETYPMILEIHGGPFANYGPRFAAECQLYAAAGYVVLYVNPRGSTSYGEEFANLIHHAYPGDDYHDLMSAVDAVLEEGYVDPEELYVTGGSGGGVLTAWIVGQTDRFKAAVVAKPVIHWASFALTADAYGYFWKYWFPGYPWEHQEHYWKRSPLSLVGNVSTPTMLLTGENDYRTPMSESEQYYQALKLRDVDTALVRIPGAGHGIANRPSQLVGKVAHVLAWFERYRGDSGEE